MIDPLSLSAEDILKSRALDIFPNENEMAAIFKKLAKRWHPDTSSGDTRVFSDINSKYQAAQKAWANGGYVSSLKIGSTIFPFMYESRFEMGELYVCPRHIIWAVKRDWDDLAKQWLEVIKKYKFPNDDVKSKIVSHIPKNSHVKAYKDRAYVIIDRPYDLIRCVDILRSEGPFDAKHMAWTISRAYNLCGFLNYANIRHNDISVETNVPNEHQGTLRFAKLNIRDLIGRINKDVDHSRDSIHLAISCADQCPQDIVWDILEAVRAESFYAPPWTSSIGLGPEANKTVDMR